MARRIRRVFGYVETVFQLTIAQIVRIEDVAELFARGRRPLHQAHRQAVLNGRGPHGGMAYRCPVHLTRVQLPDPAYFGRIALFR